MNIPKRFKTIEEFKEYNKEYKRKYQKTDKGKKKKREYYHKNKEKLRECNRKYYHKNKEKTKEYQKEYRKKNKEKLKQKYKEYYKKNKEKILKYRREYYRKTYIPSNRQKIYENSNEYYKINKGRIKNNHNNYIQKNREKWNKYLSNYINNKIKTNPQFKLTVNLRKRLVRALKGIIKSDTTMNLVGCSREYLINYIESQFDDEMSWSAYLENKIHIDHIIPCSHFNLKKEEEQRKCFHYSNLRPLWARDNLSKGNRIIANSY